jgi:hypothetical protein
VDVRSSAPARRRFRFRRIALVVAVVVLALARWAAAQTAPGDVVIARHVTIAPSWFDPSTAPPQITPFGMLLHQSQQLSIDRVMFAPVRDYRTLRGIGPGMAEHALDSMPLVPFPSLEDMRLKGQ